MNGGFLPHRQIKFYVLGFLTRLFEVVNLRKKVHILKKYWFTTTMPITTQMVEVILQNRVLSLMAINTFLYRPQHKIKLKRTLPREKWKGGMFNRTQCRGMCRLMQQVCGARWLALPTFVVQSVKNQRQVSFWVHCQNGAILLMMFMMIILVL